MVEGLLCQKNTVQGVVLQWLGVAEGRTCLEVAEGRMCLGVAEGRICLGVAEGRTCGTGRRHFVQLVEPHKHFEEGFD